MQKYHNSPQQPNIEHTSHIFTNPRLIALIMKGEKKLLQQQNGWINENFTIIMDMDIYLNEILVYI